MGIVLAYELNIIPAIAIPRMGIFEVGGDYDDVKQNLIDRLAERMFQFLDEGDTCEIIIIEIEEGPIFRTMIVLSSQMEALQRAAGLL